MKKSQMLDEQIQMEEEGRLVVGMNDPKPKTEPSLEEILQILKIFKGFNRTIRTTFYFRPGKILEDDQVEMWINLSEMDTTNLFKEDLDKIPFPWKLSGSSLQIQIR